MFPEVVCLPWLRDKSSANCKYINDILFLDLHKLISSENAKKSVHCRDSISSTSTFNSPETIDNCQLTHVASGKMKVLNTGNAGASPLDPIS